LKIGAAAARVFDGGRSGKRSSRGALSQADLSVQEQIRITTAVHISKPIDMQDLERVLQDVHDEATATDQQ
jgi:hypothetical protein